jgi:hypothetical protein
MDSMWESAELNSTARRRTTNIAIGGGRAILSAMTYKWRSWGQVLHFKRRFDWLIHNCRHQGHAQTVSCFLLELW